MIHIMLHGELIERVQYPHLLQCEPNIGEPYVYHNKAYHVVSVCVDTRKGYCELTIDECEETEPATIEDTLCMAE